MKSLARSLFQAMLHFCRAPFRGDLRPRAGGKSALKFVFRGRSLTLSDVPARPHESHSLWLAPDQAVKRRTSFVRHPRARPGISYRAARDKCDVGYSVPAPLSRLAAATAGYEGGGHTGPNAIALTVRDAKKARPADYPDLPETSRNGAELAKERNEPRLRFAARWGLAEGVDLAITMAALHYARSGQALPWRAPESRIIFSRNAKPGFRANAECDLREPAAFRPGRHPEALPSA